MDLWISKCNVLFMYLFIYVLKLSFLKYFVSLFLNVFTKGILSISITLLMYSLHIRKYDEQPGKKKIFIYLVS